MDHALRVGVLLGTLDQPNWVHQSIREIQASGVAQIVTSFVVRSHHPKVTATTNAPVDPHLLYKLYTRLDARLFRNEVDALATRSVYDLLSGYPQLEVTLDRSDDNTSWSLAKGELTNARAFGLDVLLSVEETFTPDHLAPFAVAARYGVWSYHLGDRLETKGGPGGFWEVMDCRPLTGSLLAMTSGDPPRSRIIYRSYAPSDNRSVRRSQNNYYWKTADFALRKLRNLYENGECALADVSSDSSVPIPPRYSRIPNNREMLRLLGRLATNYVRGKVDQFIRAPQWFMAFSRNGPGESGIREVGSWTSLVPPIGREWADPFPIHWRDHNFIFFEEYVAKSRKAHISVVEIDSSGRFKEPTVVLARDYHLSYPFVFEWEGQHYMIPETSQNQTVEVYRAENFPYSWKLEAVLLDNIRAVDATIAEIWGRWWMFVNVAVEGASTADELHLYYADGPLGPWTPHRTNPVKSDVRSTRPAGRIFLSDGTYIRPSQDCGERYGHAIVLNRIRRLDLNGYLEQEIGRIEPARPGELLGVHTLNVWGNLTCIDGEVKRSRLLHRFRRPSFDESPLHVDSQLPRAGEAGANPTNPLGLRVGAIP